MSDNQKTTWRSQSGFIFALIGSAVGFANILSFSAQVYKNGGGAFLIPYFFALFLLGIPMLILEGTIGNKFKAPLATAYGYVWGKAGKTLGWLAVLACLSIGAFYVVLTGYSAAYTYFAASGQIPDDSKKFFLDTFLKTTESISDFGQFSLPVFFATAGVVALTWFVLVRNVRDGIEKICSIFMPLLGIILAVFALIVMFLPGGIQGMVYYLKPDFSKLLNPTLWRDVFGQLFFSLSLGLGIIVGYARHTGEKANIAKAMLYVAIGDFAVSFIAGAAIFGCLAHISAVQNVPFDSILTSDSTFEIGFIIFPKILTLFGPLLAQIIGTIFFVCIFIAGITGVFSIVESIAGNVEVEFRTSRSFAVTATTALLLIFSTIFCFGNASYSIDALAPMVLGINMLIGGLGILFAFFIFHKGIQNEQTWTRGIYGRTLSFSLKYLATALLTVILIANLSSELQSFDLSKGVRWGWFLLVLLAAFSLSQIKPKEVKEVSYGSL